MSINNCICVMFECTNPYKSKYKYGCPFREEDESSGCKFAHNDSQGTHCENKECISDAVKDYIKSI